MSSNEFDPEAPTPKSNPDPNQHPLKAQYPSGSQPTYQVKTPDVNKINADWNQVANAIDNIAVINAQIRDVLMSTTEALSSLKDELGTADDIRSNRDPSIEKFLRPGMRRPGQAGYVQVPDYDIEPTAGFLQGRAASQQELENQRNEDIQKQVFRARLQQDPQFRKTVDEFNQSHRQDQIQMLRQYGVINEEGGIEGAFVEKKFKTTEEVQKAFGTRPQQRSADEQSLVDIINQEFRERVTDVMEKEAPRKVENLLDAVERAGIRQLRYGQLTLQDILRSSGTLAGQTVVDINAAQQWEAQAAQAREQGLPEPPRPEFQGAGRAYMAGNLVGRLAGSRAGMGLLGGVARFAPVAGQGIALAQIANQTLQNLYGRTYGSYLDTVRSGQTTGEGFRAGLGARWRGLVLGANPFDPISMRQGAEIVAATRQRGFVGRDASNMEEGIRGVVSDLGISIDQAADYFTDAMRRGGLSVEQVRKQMENFDDSAHDLNMNIQDYTASVLQQTQSLRGLGFGSAAPGISQSIMRALPVGYRNDPQAQQFFSGLIQQNRGALVARLNAQGINANFLTVTSQRYAGATTRATDDLIEQDMQIALQGLRASGNPNPSANDIANWMSQAGIYTRGADPGFLSQYIHRLRRGLGLGAQLQADRAISRYTQSISRHGSRRVDVSKMTEAERNMLGITEHVDFGHVLKADERHKGRGDYYLTTYRDAQGHKIDPGKQFSLATNAQMIRARRAALASLPENYLTKKERDILNYHIADERFKFQGHDVDFTEALRRAGSERRNIDPNKITMNGITIELKGKATRDLFKLNVERKNAVGDGSLPANKNGTRINGQ